MRTDSYIGLNNRAKKIVGKTIHVREVGVTIMPDKSVVPFDREIDKPLATVTVIGGIEGAFTEEGECVANLHRYTFPSGVIYQEYVQCVPWCGGPEYYIALRRIKHLRLNLGQGPFKTPVFGKPLKSTLWPTRVTHLSEDVNNCGAEQILSGRND
jgi:hypothetical protein